MERGFGRGFSSAGFHHEDTSRKASQSCSHRRALACAVHKYVQSTTRRRRARVWVRVCAGNIIANKYLLPVAGSINIKEKLPKNWKLSLRTMREELLYSYCRLSRYLERLYRSYVMTRAENSVKSWYPARLYIFAVCHRASSAP